MQNAQYQHFLFATSNPPIVDQRRAQEVIEPYLPDIAMAFQQAFEKFAGLDLDARARMRSGTKGHNVNDFVCSYVADALQGLPQIECCERLNFFKLIIKDEVVIRFKRLQNDLLARSAPSDQAKAWFSNSPIPGIPDHWLRCNFGYIPKSTWMACDHYYFTHQSSFYSLDWVSDVFVKHPGMLTGQVGSFVAGQREHGLPPQIEIVPRVERAIDLDQYSASDKKIAQ